MNAQEETRIEGGVYEVKREGIWFAYTHHCFYCAGCGATYSTFVKSTGCHCDPCQHGMPVDAHPPVNDDCDNCKEKLTWLSNDAAVQQRINLHRKGDGCELCDLIV